MWALLAMACTGRDQHAQKDESKSKIGASFRKIIPVRWRWVWGGVKWMVHDVGCRGSCEGWSTEMWVDQCLLGVLVTSVHEWMEECPLTGLCVQECLSGGALKCVSEALCGSSDNSPNQQEASASSAPSDASLKVAFDKISLESRMHGYDDVLESVAEPVVALSVHGWAKGHERKVVDTIKRQLHSSQITIHEIVSPADILLMFHDMTMGLNAEHLLGRMRHAAGKARVFIVFFIYLDRPGNYGT